MDITEKELSVLKHTLGLDYKPVPFRNHFSAGQGHADMPELESLVDKGLMIRRQNPFDEVNHDFIYYATKEGKEAAQGIAKSSVQQVQAQLADVPK